jgi:hypothetical protein
MILDPEQRKPLNELQRHILRIIARRIDATGVQPNLAELGLAVALSAGAVNYQIGKIEAAGWIYREGARGIVIPPEIRAELCLPQAVEVALEAPVSEVVAEEPVTLEMGEAVCHG